MRLDLKLNTFWSNIIKLTSYTLISQIIIIILSPFLTRLYSPDQIGEFTIILNISTILVSISTLRLERSIVLQKDDIDFNLITNICLILLLASSFCMFLILNITRNYLASLLRIDILYLYFITIFTMLFSLKNIIIEIGIRYSLYKQISYFLFFITTSSIILKITIGYFIGSSTIYLFYSETIALFFLITIAFVQLNKEKLKIFIPQKIQIISAIKKNKSFIKYDIITSLINISSWMLPGIILGYYFNSNVVGHYALAFSMLKLPMKLIGNNIGMVFYKESSNNISETISLKDKSMKLVITLLLSSGLPVILFFFYSIDLFSIVFGIDWKEAGNFAKILSIWTLFWLLSSPISNLYYTLGLQPQFLGFMIISIILRFSGLVVGGINNDVFLALFLYSFISSLVYIFQIFYLFKKISIPFIATINLFLYSFLIFVPFIIIIYLLSLLNNIYLGITFSILIVILFYYITVQYRLINLISSKCI